MIIIVGLAAVGAVAWAAAPWVAMARRGTVDARALAEWKTERVVPGPRRAPDDHPVPSRCWTDDR